MFVLFKLKAINRRKWGYLPWVHWKCFVSFGWPLSCVTRWALAERCWYPSNLSYSSSFSEKQAARRNRKIHLCPIHAADRSNRCTAQSLPSIRWIWAIALRHWFDEWTNSTSLIQKQKLLESSSAAFLVNISLSYQPILSAGCPILFFVGKELISSVGRPSWLGSSVSVTIISIPSRSIVSSFNVFSDLWKYEWEEAILI